MELNNFRDPKLIKEIIAELSNWQKPIKLMEVCGSHTMAIGHWGIRKLLPKTIKLLSGPGCPVCVTPQSIIDAVLQLEDVTIVTFGDLMRVPGSSSSLAEAKSQGRDIQLVYSPLDALKFAETKETVFVAIGFETTIPGIAQTILEAKKKNLENFSILSSLKTIPPALKALLQSQDIKIDGFILPGHVSVIIGKKAFSALPRKYGIGGVITGFEPLDIFIGIKTLTDQISENIPQIQNKYSRVVKDEGNITAQNIIKKVFVTCDTEWRGLGEIKNSGLKLGDEYQQFDAFQKYQISLKPTKEPEGCRCADVLKGKAIPPECKLFGNLCTPTNPIGPCMVSGEGSCAAYYKYES